MPDDTDLIDAAEPTHPPDRPAPQGAGGAIVHTVEQPAPPGIVARLAGIVAQALAFVVGDVAQNQTALERVKALRDGEKELMAYFEPSRKAADVVKKNILAARDGLIGPLSQARATYDQKALTYENAERIKADVERRRLQAVAQKEEEERQFLEAAEAEDAGDSQAAAAIIEEPVDVPVVHVAPAVAKVSGVRTGRKVWSAEVTNFLELVQHVAANPQWINLLAPNDVSLNSLAVSQRDNLAIPGVRAISRQARR